jgi:hypothetical protein
MRLFIWKRMQQTLTSGISIRHDIRVVRGIHSFDVFPDFVNLGRVRRIIIRPNPKSSLPTVGFDPEGMSSQDELAAYAPPRPANTPLARHRNTGHFHDPSPQGAIAHSSDSETVPFVVLLNRRSKDPL